MSENKEVTSLIDRRGTKGGGIRRDEPPVKFVVGAEEKHFYVERSFLPKIGFLEAALREDWLEGQTRTIKLPADDPEVFEVYVKWLYERILYVKDEDETKQPDFTLLANLYALGEKFLHILFQNDVLDAFIATYRGNNPDRKNHYPDTTAIDIIYKSTCRLSPARRLLVDMYTRNSGALCSLLNDRGGLHHEFLTDLVQAAFLRRRLMDGSRTALHVLVDGVPSSYHRNANGTPCTTKRVVPKEDEDEESSS